MKAALAFLFVLALLAPASAGAATLTNTGGDVTVTGAPGEKNTLVAVQSMGLVFFGDQNAPLTFSGSLPCFPVPVPVSGISGGVLCAGVTAVTLNGGDGDDQLVANAGTPAKLNGDAGDDTLIGGTENDTFTGGDGTDRVGYLSPEGASIDRTAGVEAVLPEPGAAPTTGNGAGSEDDSIAADIEGLIGGQGDDTLTGNGAANTIAGAAPPGTPGVTTSPAGVDTIVGGAGDDTLLAGDSGSAAGGDGNDQVVGGRDATKTTTVTGGAGDDTLVSGLGDDDLAGGDGADTLAYASVALAGLDRGTTDGVTVTLPEAGATGTGGKTGGDEGDVIHDDIETLAGSNGPDVLTGSSRDDTIAGAVPPGTPGVTVTPAGKDTIKGLGGKDQLVGGDTGTVNGGDGDDTLVGGGQATELFGDAGSDQLVSGLGNDSVHGGDGADFLVYAAVGLVSLKRDAAVTAKLADGDQTTTGNGQAGESDTVFGDVENLVGGNGNDTLTGNAGSNTIVGVAPAGTAGVTPGPAGNDTLDGAAGDDILLGAEGNDTITGGDGKDVVSAAAGDDKVFVRDTAIEAPSCGAGTDVATVDATDTPAPDCETVEKPGTTTPPVTKDTKKPLISVTPRKPRLKAKRRIVVYVRCRNEAKGCKGTVRVGKVKRSFKTKGAARKRVTLRLSKKTAKRIKRRGSAVVKLRVIARDTAGNRGTKTVKRKIRRRK